MILLKAEEYSPSMEERTSRKPGSLMLNPVVYLDRQRIKPATEVPARFSTLDVLSEAEPSITIIYTQREWFYFDCTICAVELKVYSFSK